jgi:hypothetical protein
MSGEGATMPAPKRTVRKKSAARNAAVKAEAGPGPEVIVDFVFSNGELYISVRNIGIRPALKVSVKFDKKFRGIEGTQEISQLALFRNIEFLPPGKAITTYLDRSAAYFRRGEPTRLAARLTWLDAGQVKYESTIQHDLEIYRDIGYVTPMAGQDPSRGGA